MEQIDTGIDETEGSTRPKSPLRWFVRGTFAICGTLMAMVILSEPAVRAQVGAGSAWLASLVAPRDDVAMMETETVPPVPTIPQTQEDEPRAIPQVSAMPTSRIPVRRGSVSGEN